jgi:valyl-tRNA synthetase
MSDLESNTRYDPSEVEPKIVERWLASGLFHPDPDGTPDENYSIAIPPPNVTGALHMGHALNNSVQDVLIRYRRMQGKRTKWILGTDHAGIATQTQVERALVREGTSREELGRDEFVKRVWEWREQYGGTIIEQLKRLGASCDYEDERFTLDDGYVQAVLHVFVALYRKGYIYRDRYLVNWDPGTRSAISDLEVEDREVTDTLYYIDYPLASGTGAITIATVRPETMLGDTAIAVHPEDERYRRLIGETAILPLVGRTFKIIADEYVKPEFGTGALKITPGSDPNDFEIGQRHGLAVVGAIGEDGRMTDEVPERFRGLTIKEAQDAVVAELREQGLIARTEPYTHTVPFSHRSGERIEPLVSLQWFMRMDELARPAIEAVRSGRVRIRPDSERRRYLDWLENIRPWVLSRQLWWGHRIPVWYRGDEIYVDTEPPRGEGWERDPDVLDTWFSSALWPFATLGWPQATPELRAFYPTDVLSTARDIIFLWVARMVMMGMEFTEQVPFSDVYVHSIVQAPDGRRMSKSLGTGIDPMDLINGGPRPPVFAQQDDADAAQKGEAGSRAGGKSAGDFPAYGADAVRWGLLAMSSGQDVRFSEDKVLQGQQLANKLWNASRLILLGVGGPDADVRAAVRPVGVEDRWILSRLARARREFAARIDGLDFSRAALGLYDFVYGELCDWYLELVKPRLRAGEPELSATLLYVLIETLALAHPIIPFVTEEIYSFVPGAEGLLAGRVADGAAADAVDESAEAELGRLIEAVQAVRAWRDSAGVRAGAVVPTRLAAGDYAATAEHLARLARVSFSSDGVEPVTSVPVPGGAIEILPNEDFDPQAAERKRAAECEALDREIERSSRKLANEGFVSKARPDVVQAERDKLERLRIERDALCGTGADAGAGA